MDEINESELEDRIGDNESLLVVYGKLSSGSFLINKLLIQKTLKDFRYLSAVMIDSPDEYKADLYMNGELVQTIDLPITDTFILNQILLTFIA